MGDEKIPDSSSLSQGDSNENSGSADAGLEAFSAAHSSAVLDSELASATSSSEARTVLQRHARGLVPQIEMVIRRHRKALHTMDLTKRHKILNCWRACALGLINECESDGGALPVFAGHVDFVNNLRSHLQEADSLTAFTTLLAEEEKRWRKSLFGRKKVRIIEEIRERMGAQLDKLVKQTKTRVEKTLEPRIEQQNRNYELEVGSLGDWYRHLIGSPVAAGSGGVDQRWEVIAVWENDMLARITQVRSNTDACLELGRVWNHLDKQITSGFKEQIRRMRLEGKVDENTQRDFIHSELQALNARLESLTKHRNSLEAMSEAVTKAVRNSVRSINSLSQSQLRQFDDLVGHSSVKSLPDLFEAIKGANHLHRESCKIVFDIVAGLEPFRAVRFKQRRLQSQIEAHREAFARYLAG